MDAEGTGKQPGGRKIQSDSNDMTPVIRKQNLK